MAGLPAEVSTSALGRLLGLTTRRVQQLEREAVLEKSGRGNWPLVKSVKAYIASLEARIPGPATKAGSVDIKRENARLLKARADREEIAAARETGAAVDAEQIRQAWTTLAAEVSSTLLNSVPPRAASRIVGLTGETEIKAVILDEMRLALRDLAEAPAEEFVVEDEESESDEDG